MSLQGVQATTGAAVAELFKAENGNGIDFFSAGRTQVQVGFLVDSEVDAILRSYRRNLTLVKKISPVLYDDLLNQQDFQAYADDGSGKIDPRWNTSGHSVALKFAQIAKGTLASQGGTKVITWPPQVGQIGVAWLDPYLLQYSRAKSATNPSYTDYTPNTWNLPFNATVGGGLAHIVGSSTYTKGTPPGTVSTLTSQSYYQTSSNTNQRELAFIFQNGILELGTTPDIQQWIIQTSLTSAYNSYTTHPLVFQPIEERKLIYQYNTPGVIPLYNDMGLLLAGLPQTTTTVHTMPLLGMAFYETNLLPVPENI